MTTTDPVIKFHSVRLRLSEAKNAIRSLQAMVHKAENPSGPMVLFEPYVNTMREACRSFGYSVDELLDQRRRGRISEIRAALSYCFRESTLNGLQLSFPDIAAHVYGGRGHASALYACSRIASRLEMGDDETTSDVRRITAIMLSHGIERKSR